MNTYCKFSHKIPKTLSKALETAIFEFLVKNYAEIEKAVPFWQNRNLESHSFSSALPSIILPPFFLSLKLGSLKLHYQGTFRYQPTKNRRRRRRRRRRKDKSQRQGKCERTTIVDFARCDNFPLFLKYGIHGGDMRRPLALPPGMRIL